MNRTNVKEPEGLKSVEPHQGYAPITPSEHEDDHEHAHPLAWQEIARVLFVASAAVAMWFVGRSTNPYIIAIGVICTIVGGFPIFHEAYENITQRRMTMELSMAIAIVAALAIREFLRLLSSLSSFSLQRSWRALRLVEAARPFNISSICCQAWRPSAEADRGLT